MPPDKLTESDRRLLQSAAQARQQAEATHEFIARHVAAAYDLGDGCEVDIATGVITRPVTLVAPVLMTDEDEAERA